jgi:tetratricopeptide (TPR) repeat protein
MIGMRWTFNAPNISFNVRDCLLRSKRKGASITFNVSDVELVGFEILHKQKIGINANGQLSASDYFEAGDEKYNAEQYREAIQFYTKAIKLKPDYAVAFNNRGIVCAILKDYEAAIRDFTKFIELKPDYADAYNRLGYLYLDKGALDSAEESFSTCLQLDNKYWDASLGLALLYFQKRDMPSARKYLAMGSAVEPRLKDGTTGIEKLELEGWGWSESQKKSLRRLFEAVK